MSDPCNRTTRDPLAFIEGQADAWAARVDLNAMIENATSPMRLNRSAMADGMAPPRRFRRRLALTRFEIVAIAFAAVNVTYHIGPPRMMPWGSWFWVISGLAYIGACLLLPPAIECDDDGRSIFESAYPTDRDAIRCECCGDLATRTDENGVWLCNYDHPELLEQERKSSRLDYMEARRRNE